MRPGYLLIPMLVLMLTFPIARACMSPADSYAVEVVLNKPGVVFKPYPTFKALHNAIVENGTFIFRSHYDERLYVLLWNGSDGPHLRIQIPLNLKAETLLVANLNVSLLLLNDEVEKLKKDGWRVIDNRTFEKDGVRITLNPIVGGECTSDSDCATGGCSGEVCAPKEKASSIVTPCVYKPWYTCLAMTTCGCVNGVCTWKPNPAFESCLREHGVDPASVIKAGRYEMEIRGSNVSTDEVTALVSEFLRVFGISCNRSLNLTKVSVTKPVPAVDPSEVNASMAVKTELEWLIQVGVLKIDEKDVEEISRVASWGNAGWNSHIGWYKTKKGTYAWIPYDKSLNPRLVKCFTKSIPTYKLPNGTAYVASTSTQYSSTTSQSGKICGPALLVMLSVLFAARRR
ncbi:CGP-CTERM-anchored Cys-rich protein [Thermococcus sp.]